jgi:hypothetical protein
MQSREDSPSHRDASLNDDTRSAAPADLVPDAQGRDADESNTRKFPRRIDCTDQVEPDDGQSVKFGRGRHSNNRGRNGTSLS